MVLEKNLQKNVLKFCKEYSILAVKVDSTSGRGWPDLTCVLPNGTVLFIELKTATGVLSKLQKRMIKKLERNNAHVYTIRSLEQFEQTVKPFITDRPAK